MKLFLTAMAALLAAGPVQAAGELRFALRADPKTFHPLRAADEASETVRYLTCGVLLRLNRVSQALEPELAVSWQTSAGGRRIRFRLRQGVRFSSGAPFTADDVVFTVQTMMDPALQSPVGDSFRAGPGTVRAVAAGPHEVEITFPAPVAGLERLFDQVAMLARSSPKPEEAVLGPFRLAAYRPGAHVLLRRNPHYWKKDEKGVQLPYLDSVRLEIQSNREIELLRFRRGEFHLMETLDPELYDRLARQAPGVVREAGVSLEGEQMWFNQAPAASLAAHKLAWFRSTAFRRAVSEAIRRQDLCRIVYRGRAQPAAGMVSPANRFWVHGLLRPPAPNPEGALARLAGDGFRLDGAVLRDRRGNAVEFSLITNSGNKARERMAAMIQQDLKRIGMRVNVVPLDMASVIERITRTFAYEACLLGLVNVDLDPNAQMNVWLSSGANHQWNPGQKKPATPWEAEIDRLMRAQASTADAVRRKASFDRVQEVVAEQVPFIYLVYKHALSAVSPALRGVAPSALRPRLFWNVERLSLAGGSGR